MSQVLPGLPSDEGVRVREPKFTNALPTLPTRRMGLLGQSQGPQTEKANFRPEAAVAPTWIVQFRTAQVTAVIIKCSYSISK